MTVVATTSHKKELALARVQGSQSSGILPSSAGMLRSSFTALKVGMSCTCSRSIPSEE